MEDLGDDDDDDDDEDDDDDDGGGGHGEYSEDNKDVDGMDTQERAAMGGTALKGNDVVVSS